MCMLKKMLLGTTVWAIALVPALAQTQEVNVQAYKDQKKAAMTQQLVAGRQQDIEFASGCLMASRVLSEARGSVIASVLGDDVPLKAREQAEFWTRYLERLGAKDNPAIDSEASKFTLAIRDNPPGPAGMLQQPWQVCSGAYTFLTVNSCSTERGLEPVTFHVPMAELAMVKVCREIVQDSSEWTPSKSVEENPEYLAQFNADRQAERDERDFFDRLLEAQPSPQCPVSPGPFMSAGYADTRQQVDDAYSQWYDSKDIDDPLVSSQQPYIQWQLACDKLKLLTGYTKE